jgi:hypothetical protein
MAALRRVAMNLPAIRVPLSSSLTGSPCLLKPVAATLHMRLVGNTRPGSGGQVRPGVSGVMMVSQAPGKAASRPGGRYRPGLGRDPRHAS